MKNKLYLQKIICLFLMICGMKGFSQFSGAFAPANWNFSTTTFGGDGSVNTSGAPSSIILNGSDNGGGGSNQYEQYSITIPSNGKISFAYSHINPDLDDAQYVINGVATNITYAGSGSLANISVNAGDVFSFRVTNYDNCCGRGVLTISNFGFISGESLNFDGVNDKVVLSNSINSVLDPLNTITVEAWVNPTNTVFNGVIAGNYGSPSNNMQFLLRRDGNSYTFWVDAGTGYQVVGSGASSVMLNTWQHVAGVWDGSALYIYINGVLMGTTTGVTGSSFASTSNNIVIGSNSVNEHFAGSIDEVRIWTIARTQCDIISYKNCEIPTTAAGLLANYHFNQGIAAGNNPTENNLTDASGNSNTGALTGFALTGATSNWVAPGGVISGSITPSTCTPAAALKFDGVNDYVTAPNNATINFGTGDFTVESYFKSSVSQPNYAGIVSKFNSSGLGGFQLVIVNNKIAAEFSNSSTAFGVGNGLIGTSVLTDGNWHHLAMVVKRSANQIQLLVDGLVEATFTNSATSSMNVNFPAAALLIGVERTNGVRINGNLDEVRLWNVARTQCEINTYMNCEIPTTSTGLVANYHFNQGVDAFNNPTIASLTDASGNSNTGTLTNFALSGSTSNWVAPGGVVSGFTTALAPPTISVNSGAICLGQSFIMTPSGAVTYTFSNGSAIATPTADATYSVSGSDANGCVSISDAISSVTVNICTPAAALNFDGADDYVQLLDPNFGMADFTLETWMNPNTAVGAYLISTRTSEFGAGGNWFTLSYGNTGKIGLELADAGIGYSYFETPGTPIVINVWNHVAVVRSGLNFSIYVNGVLSASYTDTGIRNFITGTNSIRLSGWAEVGVSFFNGKMDETRFWNVARTQCEINTFKDCEIPSSSSGLIVNYHFNQGFDAANNPTEINLMDASGNSNTGTITNFALTGATSNWVAAGGVVSSYTTTLAPPTIAVNSGAICAGESFTMVPSGASTYTYSSGSAVVSPTSNASYSITGTSALGCVGSNTAVSSLTVNATPTVSVTSGAICAGQSFTMVPSGASTYTYSSGSAVVSPTSNASYNVTGTSALGCLGSNTAVSSLTVNATPTVSVTSGVICSGSSFTMVSSGASTYTYSSGSAVVSPTSNASYNVTGTDANGCVGSNTAVSSVTVNALPMLMVSTTNTLLCSGQTATLSVSGATSYTWNTSQTTSSIAVTPTVQTTYTIEGVGANGCSNSTTITQDVSLCTGIASLIAAETMINVYPNPNKGLFIIELNETSQISISNTLGQVIMFDKLDAGKHNLDIQNQSTGIYFVKVIQDGKQHTIKLIKE